MSCEFCYHDNPHDTRCPNAPEPKTHGRCKQCLLPLRHDYPYWMDTEDNRFCSEECAKTWNGIQEMEWADE